MSEKLVKVECPACGGGSRNHKILAEINKPWSNEGCYIRGGDSYQICECVGCETVRFRKESWSEEHIDPRTGDPEINVKVYPEHIPQWRRDIDTSYFPEKVTRIYQETLKAYNAGSLILAGGGLRAIVEAVCIDRNVVAANLQAKIDKLAEEGLLAKTQADLLHEERYIGNAALHEVEPPAGRDIQDGLDIVETLLSTIYTLPKKAQRLKEQRAASTSCSGNASASRQEHA